MNEKQNEYITAGVDFVRYLLSEDVWEVLGKHNINLYKEQILKDIFEMTKKVLDEIIYEIKYQRDLDRKRQKM